MPYPISLGSAVLSDLAPKTNHMFHFTGKDQSTPNCPVQLVANFNPGTGSQSYQSSDKHCTGTAKYRLPFYLKDMGPKYNAISVGAHEARPGHHTQVRNFEIFQQQQFNAQRVPGRSQVRSCRRPIIFFDSRSWEYFVLLVVGHPKCCCELNILLRFHKTTSVLEVLTFFLFRLWTLIA